MKKITIIFGVVAVGLLIIDSWQLYFCDTYKCREVSDGILLSTLALIGTSFIILMLLNFLPVRIFNSWWKFARVAVPVILVLSIVVNLQFHHRSGGLFNMDNLFDLPILILMYGTFVVGSLVQIYRGYRSK